MDGDTINLQRQIDGMSSSSQLQVLPSRNNNNNNNNNNNFNNSSAAAPLISGWVVKKPSFTSPNEFERRQCWTQIFTKGEEISRQATDAHKRDFTLEEMQRVEMLALSILTDVRKMLNKNESEMMNPVPQPPAPTMLTFSPMPLLIPSAPMDLKVGAIKKRRGRPPIKKPLFCVECGTTETPEWRRGEAGPNTLCNGCGLRYAKRLKQESESKKKHSIDILLNEKREQLARSQALAKAQMLKFSTSEPPELVGSAMDNPILMGQPQNPILGSAFELANISTDPDGAGGGFLDSDGFSSQAAYGSLNNMEFVKHEKL